MTDRDWYKILGKWTHIVKVYDEKEGRINLYINGVKQTRWGRFKAWLLRQLGYRPYSDRCRGYGVVLTPAKIYKLHRRELSFVGRILNDIEYYWNRKRGVW